MKVRDLMTPLTECVGPSDTVAAAETVLSSHRVPALPVLDHRQPAGTLGTEEIETRVPQGKHPGFVRVQEIMTGHTLYASPDDDVEEARERMRQSGLHSLPVLEHGRLVGALFDS